MIILRPPSRTDALLRVLEDNGLFDSAEIIRSNEDDRIYLTVALISCHATISAFKAKGLAQVKQRATGLEIIEELAEIFDVRLG